MPTTLDKWNVAKGINGIDFAQIAAREDTAQEFRSDCYRRLIDSGNRPLLSRATANTKTRKSMRVDYRIVALALAHADESGKNVCPQSTPACRAHCVGGDSVGMAMVWDTIMQGRIRKTQFLHADRTAFLCQLIGELEREQRIADREGSRLVVRLNTFSDIPWEHRNYGMVPQLFGSAVFYDYTKLHGRVMGAPFNMHLCGSWSEKPKHQEACWDLLHQGKNVAVAFGSEGSFTGYRALMQPIPKRFRILSESFEVFSGDETDLRFLDQGPDERGYGRVCGLAFKSGTTSGHDAGLASGFVVMQ